MSVETAPASLLHYERYGRAFTSFLVISIAVAMTFYFPSEYFPTQNDHCYRFLSEWYDPIAGLKKSLNIAFYTKDNSVEMFDVQAKKVFLKRVHIQDVKEKDFYVGSTVKILSRQLKIIDFADEFTEKEIRSKRQKTFAMIKPDAVHRIGEVVEFIQNKGFEVTQMKMVALTRGQARQFYEEHSERPFFDGLVEYITSGPVIALELIGPEAVTNWRKTLGPTDSEVARAQDPGTLRSVFGTNKQENAAHGSDSHSSAERELNFFFSGEEGRRVRASARLEGTVCCVIKPHAVAAGDLGKILTAISQEGFQISGLQMFRLVKSEAEEFLEVYKEVLPEYPRMVQQLISGPLVALEVWSDKEAADDSQAHLREYTGPMDPEVARELRPHSLRAIFGEDKIKNGVHCTDLPEDRSLEVDFFFKILQQ